MKPLGAYHPQLLCFVFRVLCFVFLLYFFILCVCVCMSVCVFIKLHITAQSGPVILVILSHSH